MIKSFMFLCFCFLFIVFSATCSKADRGDGTETPQTLVETSKSQYLFKLDGKLDDWTGIEPLWNEGGMEYQGGIKTNVDIKQVYVKNDNKYLYVFMKIVPTIEERSKFWKGSGRIGDLYFDVDNNLSTGAKTVFVFQGSEADKFKGYEIRVGIPIGSVSTTEGTASYISFNILKQEGEGFSSIMRSFNQDSINKGSLIAHGSDGIEFALPLEKLGLTAPTSVRVLLGEFCHSSKEDGYTSGNINLK